MNHRRFFAALALAALLAPAEALAGDPTDADRATARALAADAHKALDAKDYALAADRFGRADALVHAPTLALGLARARVGLGKLVAAQETYQRILREGVPANASKVFVKAVDDAKQELAALTPRIAWVTVSVTGAPDATVQLDGVVIPPAAVGVPRAVDPGAHVASATTAGGVPVQATVTVGEGKTTTVNLEVHAGTGLPVAPVPLAPPVAPPPVATAPPPLAPTAVPPAPPPEQPPPPTQASSTQRTVGMVSVGLGAAGLILGGVTGAMVLGQHGTLASGCTGGRCPPSLVSKLDSYNTLGAISTVGFIAGGGLAVLGVVLIATAPGKSAPRVGLSVGPTPGGAALGAAGSF